jgi:hypothetical protein
MWPPLVASARGNGFADYAAVSVPSLLFLLYLPAVVFLLRQPNVEVGDEGGEQPCVLTKDSLPAPSA